MSNVIDFNRAKTALNYLKAKRFQILLDKSLAKYYYKYWTSAEVEEAILEEKYR